MSREVAFNFLDGGPGWETVALRQFGGRLGDREAAWILVSGNPVIRVVAPATRNDWNQETEDRFRETVRTLAATHRFERSGPVSVLFDPPDTDREVVTEIPEGEPVDRLDRQ